jgi:hypothetical protein
MTPSGNKTKTLLKTMWASYIVASTSNGIMTMDTLTFPCPNTSSNNSLVMLTPYLTDHSIAPSCTTPLRMAKILKHLCLLMTVLSLMTPVRIAENYARAVNPTILMALSKIATQQAASSENTKKQVDQFLDYMWTHP